MRSGGRRAGWARWARFARPALAVLIVAAVGYAVVAQWPDVSRAIRTLAWPSVLLAFAAVVAGSLCAVMSWRALLAEEGHPLRPVEAGRIFLVGQLGKYLPGSVWSVVIQMELAQRAGVPRARTFTASLAWIGLSLSSALVVGLTGVPGDPGRRLAGRVGPARDAARRAGLLLPGRPHPAGQPDPACSCARRRCRTR